MEETWRNKKQGNFWLIYNAEVFLYALDTIVTRLGSLGCPNFLILRYCFCIYMNFLQRFLNMCTFCVTATYFFQGSDLFILIYRSIVRFCLEIIDGM